ncbi:hypothetical protein [Aurantiacibacter spongiae]|uniref:Lipoprotein n=1 Tax=Aurantiacibacter spongiae TaxID=2488860 RepID=A0A3N5CNB9_9SPHN|nr:hypothetical protein [Aurantiacibacter spongiae]RPF70433.1 hypothetical protein EG799_01415 [Aurantiacibacter spongiae]
MRTFHRVLIVGALVALSACRHDQPAVEVRSVEVPVAVPCLPADRIPDEPPLVAPHLTGDPAHDIAIIAPSALLLRDWGRQMHAALVACAD